MEDFSHAKASYDTYYGNITSAWVIDGKDLVMDVTIPANTSANIFIPAVDDAVVTEKGKAIPGNMIANKLKDGYIEVKVGSGNYHFVSQGAASSGNEVQLEDYVGKYKVESGMITTITVKLNNGKLEMIAHINSGEITPVAGEKDVFISGDGTKVFFTRDDSGKVTKVKMEDIGMTFEGVKE